MKMTVQDALNAAHDAETEGLLGKYPMAARTLAQELNHHVAKNALLTPEVQRAQDRSRERMNQIQAAKDFIQHRVEHGDKPNTYKLELNHDQVSELNEILSQI